MEVWVRVRVIERGLGHHVVELLQQVILIFANRSRNLMDLRCLSERCMRTLGILGLPRVRKTSFLVRLAGASVSRPIFETSLGAGCSLFAIRPLSSVAVVLEIF